MISLAPNHPEGKIFRPPQAFPVPAAGDPRGVAGAHGRRGAGGGAQRAVSGLPVSGYGAQRPDPCPRRALPGAGYGRPDPVLSAAAPAAALSGEPEISQPVVSAHGIPLRIPAFVAEGAARAAAVEPCVRYRGGKRHRQLTAQKRDAPAHLYAAERLPADHRRGKGGGGSPGVPLAHPADARRAAPAGAGVRDRRPPPVAEGCPGAAPADANPLAAKDVAEDRRADADRAGPAGQGGRRGHRCAEAAGQSRQPQPPQLQGFSAPVLRPARGGKAGPGRVRPELLYLRPFGVRQSAAYRAAGKPGE